MKTFCKKTKEKYLDWLAKNPKRFFMYSMIFLLSSFIVSIVQDIFFPSDMTLKIKPPVLYSKSSVTQNEFLSINKQMKKIVDELKTLKGKRDREELQQEDSLRIEYLFNQYQHLKNGH